MKVLKFGSTAIASPERLKIVTKLVSQIPNSIVILSAIAGTTGQLEEISDYLYKKNPEGANESINRLEKEYLEKIEELYSTQDIKEKAQFFVKEKMSYIRSFRTENCTGTR